MPSRVPTFSGMRTTKWVDAFTFESVDTIDGKVMASRTGVISKDGKMLTVTGKGINAQGQPSEQHSRLREAVGASVITGRADAQPAVDQDPAVPAASFSGASNGVGHTAAAVNTLVCESKASQRIVCPANTSAGVAMLRSTGSSACLHGKTWGYDDKGIWVSDGCSGTFALGEVKPVAGAAQAATPPPATGKSQPAEPTDQTETWGVFDPGKGFLVGRSSLGELAISGYALVRYTNQTPGVQTFTDHLGNTRNVDGRHDIWPHRVMVFMKGWLGDPKLIYAITYWTVLDTAQNAIFGNLGYQFSRKFNLYAGLNGNPGTRSLQGSHPFWLGHDRVMADEFFRPYFGSGVWAQGETKRGLWYNVMVGGTNSILDVKSSQLDRKFSAGASMWWMPTTDEFGPHGAYGDWEWHEKVATRFGASWTWSPEERFTNSGRQCRKHHAQACRQRERVRAGALAPGVTINNADFTILAIDAGVKYKGFFLQTEIYNRWLDQFDADGPIPVGSVHDTGFFVQGAFFPVKQKLELYGVTSQIFGDKNAGFSNSSEYGVGANFYPTPSRNHRLNMQISALIVHQSAAHSVTTSADTCRRASRRPGSESRGTNRGPRPPIRVLHIGRYGGGCGLQPAKMIRQ